MTNGWGQSMVWGKESQKSFIDFKRQVINWESKRKQLQKESLRYYQSEMDYSDIANE